MQTLMAGGVPNMTPEAQRSLARDLDPVIGESALRATRSRGPEDIAAAASAADEPMPGCEADTEWSPEHFFEGRMTDEDRAAAAAARAAADAAASRPFVNVFSDEGGPSGEQHTAPPVPRPEEGATGVGLDDEGDQLMETVGGVRRVRICLVEEGGAEPMIVSPSDELAPAPGPTSTPIAPRRPGELDAAGEKAFEELSERFSGVSLAGDVEHVRISNQDQFSTPFGAPSRLVKLLSDAEASVGNGRVNLDSEMFEYLTPAERGQLRKEYNQKLGVPDGFDDTYVNPYVKSAKDAYTFEEPSDFMKYDANKRLAALLGQGRQDVQAAGAPAVSHSGPENDELDLRQMNRVEVAAAITERLGRRRPVDLDYMINLPEDAVEHLQKYEPWFQDYEQWIVPICRCHMSCPQEDKSRVPLSDFITQNRFHGAPMHDWFILDPDSQTQGRLRVKFNPMTKDAQLKRLDEQKEESTFQKRNSMHGYIEDYLSCVFVLEAVTMDPRAEPPPHCLPDTDADAEVAQCTQLVQIAGMYFEFLT